MTRTQNRYFIQCKHSIIDVLGYFICSMPLSYDEKQQKLRVMMRMHGLGDGPYWIISYGYFLALSTIYMLCFVIFGSVLGKNVTISLCSWHSLILSNAADFIFRI